MQKLRLTLCVPALWAALSVPASATVTVLTLGASPKSPQRIGTVTTWQATATDTNSGLLTFQFTVTDPVGNLASIYQYNAGTVNGGVWTSGPFKWTPTGIEGAYTVQVIAKDWATGESDMKSVQFQANPLVTGTNPVVVRSSNPLVYYFSAPSCPTGSSMQVLFQQQTTGGGGADYHNSSRAMPSALHHDL